MTTRHDGAAQPPGPPGPLSLDALVPAAMAARAADVGVAKANLAAVPTLVLAVLGGAFIALGAAFSAIVLTGAHQLPFGVARLLTGLAFSIGLVLVAVGGAELFTGNNLIVLAWASRRITAAQVLRNWLIVYVGNLIGALATAALVMASGVWRQAAGETGRTIVAMATAKLAHGTIEAIALGILCNALVCLALWLSMSARSTADRILAIAPPITAFVACGFEHSVANMFLLPLAHLVAVAAPELATGPAISWTAMWRDNLLPVTLGNVIGGAGLVGLVYWFVYLRSWGPPRRSAV
jgi:formate transporter